MRSQAVHEDPGTWYYRRLVEQHDAEVDAMLEAWRQRKAAALEAELATIQRARSHAAPQPVPRHAPPVTPARTAPAAAPVVAVIVGCAVTYHQPIVLPSMRGPDSVEMVAPGAFRRFLATGPTPGVSALVNHEHPWAPLGHTRRNGGLELFEGPRGLGFRLELRDGHPQTKRVIAAARSGALRGVSVNWAPTLPAWQSSANGNVHTIEHAAIKEISLAIDRRPAYYTVALLDGPDARCRLAALVGA